MAIGTNPEYVRQLESELFAANGKNKELEAQYNACHADLVSVMRILHCIAEAPAPSMEQTVVVRGVCELADRVRKADDRVRGLSDELNRVKSICLRELGIGIVDENVLNATPQQTAEQIERWHIEWMKTLQPAQWFIDVTTNDTSTGRYEVAAEDCRDEAIPLYKIPPLPKE